MADVIGCLITIRIVHEALRRREVNLRAESTGVVARNRRMGRKWRCVDGAGVLCRSQHREAGNTATGQELHN